VNETIVVNGLQRVRPGSPVSAQRVAMGEQHLHAGQTMYAQTETCVKLSDFFIDRPIFAAVLSAFIRLAVRSHCQAANQ